MTTIELSSEAFEEIQTKMVEAGLISVSPKEWDQDPDPFTIGGVTFREWKYIPTADEIARRDAFRATPLGQLIEHSREIAVAGIVDSLTAPNPLLDHLLRSELPTDFDDKIGSTLQIRTRR